MGFHAEIVLLYPERWPNAQHTVWSGEEIISFGYITSLEKISDERYIVPGRSHHNRVNICVLTFFLEKLYDKLRQPDVSCFAPQILIYNVNSRPHAGTSLVNR